MKNSIQDILFVLLAMLLPVLAISFCYYIGTNQHLYAMITVIVFVFDIPMLMCLGDGK